MRRMIDAGIEIHAQVVLCPEINDGEILERTIRDLAADYPTVRSVAVVPLGLTRYNTDARLTPVTPEFCRRTIQQLKPLQRELHATLGTNFAFLGDEFYLRAGLPVPSRRHYGDYPQIEDGVGMVRSFHEDFRRLWRKLERRPPAQPEKTARHDPDRPTLRANSGGYDRAPERTLRHALTGRRRPERLFRAGHRRRRTHDRPGRARGARTDQRQFRHYSKRGLQKR
jgi:hypothetical protein